MSEHKSFLAQYGTPKHQDDVVKSITNSPVMDRSWDDNAALESAIKTGKRSHIENVLNGKHLDSNNIFHIVKYGNDSDRDKFIDDPVTDVRREIAKYGNDSHRDKLVNDPSHRVRMNVAIHGNDSHREKLLNDTSHHVESAIFIHGNDHHKKFINDRNDEKIKQDLDKYGLS